VRVPAPTDPGASRFRPDIQAMRALAVLLVVSSHVLGWPEGGFVGVDVFFVISGFLITRMLLESSDRPWPEVIGGFYVRRARRILPAALVTLAVTTLVARLVLSGARADRVATDGVWAALFGANWHFADVGTDYFASSTPPSPLQHYWSLAVEEQFYLVWPVLLVLAFAVVRVVRRGTAGRTSLVLACVVAVASFAWACRQSAADPTWAYFSTSTRAWEIAVGAALACVATSCARLPERVREVVAGTSLVLIVLAAVLIGDGTRFPGPGAAIPVLATAAFLAAGTGTPRPLGVHRLVTTRPVLHLGVLSFAVYLWHWPVLVLADAVLDGPQWLRAAAVIVTTLVLAEVTYRLVERPFLRTGGRAERVHPWRWAVVAGAAAVVMLAALPGPGAERPATAAAPLPTLGALPDSADPMGAMTGTLQAQMAESLAATGFPTTVPPVDQPDDGVTPEMTDFSARCLNPPDPTDTAACSFVPTKPNGRTVVILGDSIATAWLPGIREALAPEGYTVHAVTFSSCPPAPVDLGVGTKAQREECVQGRAAALDQVDRLEPDLVVASTHQDTFGGIVVDAPALDVHQTYVQALVELGERVRGAGGRLVLLGPPPAGPSPLACGGPMQRPVDCVTSSYGNFDATLFAFSTAAEQGGFGFVNTAPWFCVETSCPVFAAGRLIRWDDAHLTHQFATYLAPLLREHLTYELAQPPG
jgi:peptidoglycan/LPS O-acetylase OafA/YrhL